jgi:putative endonuclease
MPDYYVYIMTNPSRTLYVGVTNNLERCVAEHKSKSVPGFTSRYNVTELVFYEIGSDIEAAISREKQIKGWRRRRKMELVEAGNPDWHDPSADWTNE